jgi:hypothetical protein
MNVEQNAAQKRRSKQKIIKLQQKHGVAEEGSMEALPAPVQASPHAAPRPSDADNPYSGGKDKVARERARGRQGQAGAAGPMRRRLEGADRDSGNNPFVMAADNVSFANGFSHNQKLSKLLPAPNPAPPRPENLCWS